MRSGIKIEEETVGEGREAKRDDKVVVRYDLFLNRGECIRSDERYEFVLDHRQIIAGLRYGVEGMRVGGRRRFRVSPHLAYREKGVPDIVPHDAVLIFDVTLLAVEKTEA